MVGVTAVVVLLLALIVAVLAVALVRRHRLRQGAPAVPGLSAPLPVVLVHGFCGFDWIGIRGARLHYFRGIARHLESLGCTVHVVRLPRVASVPERAKALVETIEALPYPRVDIIAHSLGGLDSRYALARLGLAQRTRSLVTIGTPHHGTPLANLATTGPLRHARRAVAALGISMKAVDWLSTSALAKFNAEVRDVPGVRYACIVGGIHDPRTPVPLAIAPVHAYLRRVAGPNDGVVPVASQYWGETLAEIEADHFAQVGWNVTIRGNFDAPELYTFIVQRLGERPVNGARREAPRSIARTSPRTRADRSVPGLPTAPG